MNRDPIPLLAFKDNYIWMLVDSKNKTAIAVDPGDAKPVLELLKKENLSLSTILITHHHHDHTGGVAELIQKTGAFIYGTKDKLFENGRAASEGDNIELKSHEISFSVLEIPGHTLDHIAFLGNSMIFSGDTLFAGGCGRVFEGTYEQMLASLQKIKRLPKNTRIFCGHEYTEANLKFALLVEPNNIEIKNRLNEVQKLRMKNLPTLPSFLEVELKTNPFLRTDSPNVIKAANEYAGEELKNEVQVFSTIRLWKNQTSF
jgi:hydroxyacylglutathione hydrolase